MAYKSDYYEWEEDQKKGLSSKGKAATLKELSNLADLGKKIAGTSPEMRAAYSEQIKNTDPVKKGGPQEASLSTRVKWQDESAIVSPENEEYEQLKVDMFGKKKKNGKKT